MNASRQVGSVDKRDMFASAVRHKYDPGWADAPLPRGTCARSAPNQHDVP
jgi:hypothetical protein